MISDLDLGAKCPNLGTFYAELCQLHADAHGEDYILVHEEIRRCMDECESYTELGVNQGATLAAAMLCGAKQVTGYDIDLTNYRPAKRLFSDYATRNGVKLTVIEGNSLNVTLEPMDVLYIDSKHTREHLAQELKLHGNLARKYIICHDTHSKPSLFQAIHSFRRGTRWKVVNDCRVGTGFATLAR